ncbi:hypothetical protein [Wielerella bovis]|uniref:hypothetical protein n=1 Tax=Wielerella bovis TaxID=2917790 RepID=UPI002019DE40|nr:hypothetical protein [Wielerella bovis]ULJ60346.1 hypothetical protein MIS44_00135 [Wielerella bovis]ULJ64778.1 hypothetical protein MIS33_00160 [Wielerella bovis]ULJ67050.1 hypothetical protein MIS31_00160 [Wielerella bovis]
MNKQIISELLSKLNLGNGHSLNDEQSEILSHLGKKLAQQNQEHLDNYESALSRQEEILKDIQHGTNKTNHKITL